MSIAKHQGERIAAAITPRGGALAFVVLLCALVGWLSLWSAPALACPNEELRVGLSAGLPDCRAYEMVSPLDKNGYYVTTGDEPSYPWVQASTTGGAVAYTANGAFPGSVSNALLDYYRAVRGGAGWSTQSLLPPQAYSYGAAYVDPAFAAYSSDLSRGVLLDSTDSPALVSGEPETVQPGSGNLFVRDSVTGAYSLLNVAAPGLEPLPYAPTFDGASAAFATVIFNATAALTPEAPGGGVDNLYVSAGGAVSLVSQIPPPGEPSCGPAGPACVPVPNAVFGAENANGTIVTQTGLPRSLVRVISSDGSRIFFTANGGLYVRENAATTVQIDASSHGPEPGHGAGGGGVWRTAAADGSTVFFTDDASAGLTASTVPGSGTNLYSYDTVTENLTDLTPSANAGVGGVVDEASEDGSHLYFLAGGALTSEKNSLGEEAQAGGGNLYLVHDGAISFVHTISDPEGGGLDFHAASRVTPDGRHLAFFAEDRLTRSNGYPQFAQLFEYSADSGRISHLCACDLSEFPQQMHVTQGFHQSQDIFQYSRDLSDDGSRVFFESSAALLPRDTNGQMDVYEYERDGAGSCQAASGCLYLISSGTSPYDSHFADASASGDDVFFTTSQQLAPADTDGAYDLYDARAGGGILSPPQPPPCLGDACLNVPPAPIDATPASLTFAGAGNITGEVNTQITPRVAPATNAQKLARAVKACRKGPKRQRRVCETQARKRYAKTAGGSRARHASTNRRAVR